MARWERGCGLEGRLAAQFEEDFPQGLHPLVIWLDLRHATHPLGRSPVVPFQSAAKLRHYVNMVSAPGGAILERNRGLLGRSMLESEAAVETESEEQQAGQEEVSALAVSVDDFSALEERVRRAVDVVKRERQARAAVEARLAELETRVSESEARAAQAEAQVQAQSPLVERLESEMSALRTERNQVRERVERLLKQLDALEL